ncbi:hypothetical protein GCM10009425_41180 [Pseudomonas asuensis]|uniref:XRE family transcriptional regulator n=1 Tax=Pseudomonas asuensis TaxID=1825787 RepID=A0ABQ2H2Y1_9PSED|nr:hypothetical protein GCM10009425_41180 [Pseudomonas asuensis]
MAIIMSPAEFKQSYRSKGWTSKALAARWNLSESWVSQLTNNPSRASHWNDAVRGLPYKIDRLEINGLTFTTCTKEIKVDVE